MRKKDFIFFWGFLLCLCGCESIPLFNNEPENVFESLEGSSEDGYTVKNLTWGMSEDEVRESLDRENLETETDRLIFTSSEDDDLQYTELYSFEDSTRSSLITVEYTWSAISEDSFQAVVNSLYESAAQRMTEPDQGGKLTKAMVETGVEWTAADNSSVRVMSSTDQNIISVRISGPREVPKTLMPSN